jgi:hypothetical protein
LVALIRDAPNGAASIIGHEERAILSDSDSDRTPPYMAVVDDKAGEEVFIFARRDAVLQVNANDLATRAAGSIPRAM